MHAAIAGDRRSLARLISRVEEGSPTGTSALRALFPRTGHAHVTGVTGAPGAGKSTLTDRLIAEVRAAGDEIAVVAVDPSSPFTGGAILGDRVRMQGHIDDPGVYIRSLGSRGALGGISAATPRVVAVLDGVGFPHVVVETVGVGQAEVEIASNTDTTIVVVNPGWGDSVQAAKAGLLEIGEVFVINKMDRQGADETERDLQQMLMLGEQGGWLPPIVRTNALTGEGVSDVWKAVLGHREWLEDTGELASGRAARLEAELRHEMRVLVERRVHASAGGADYATLVAEVTARRIDPWSAAASLVG